MSNVKTEKKSKVIIISAVIVMTVILGCYTSAVYHMEYDQCFERETMTLSGYHRDVCGNLLRKAEFENELDRMIQKRHIIRMRMDMTNLLDMTWESVDSLSADLDSYDAPDYYQLDGELNTVSERANVPLELSVEQLGQLTREGTLSDSTRTYIAQKIDGGYIVMACDTDREIMSQIDYELSNLVSYAVWDNATGEILESRLTDLPVDVQALSRSDMDEEPLTCIDNIRFSRISFSGEQFLTAKSVLTVNSTEVTVCTFKEDGHYNQRTNFYTFCALFIAVLFLSFSAVFLYRLSRKRPNGCHAMRRRFRKVITSAAVLFVLISTLLFSFQNILHVSGEVKADFSNVFFLDEERSRNTENIYSSAMTASMEFLDTMVYALNYSYEVDTDEWLKEMASFTEADEITLYDQDGMIVHSTTPYRGYRLSTIETDPEYRLWQILNGCARNLFFYSEEEQRTYMAVRRTDEVGVLLLVTSGNILSPLIEDNEFANLLMLEDYPDGSRLYYKQGTSETLYVIESGAGTGKIVSEFFPVELDEDNVIGMCGINGKDYLYIRSGVSNWTFVFAYPTWELVKNTMRYAEISAILYFLLTAVIVFLFRRLIPKCEQSSEDAAESDHDIATAGKLYFRQTVSALAGISVILILLNSVFCSDSLNVSEFFEYWERGFNAVSLVFALYSLLICVGIIQLIMFANGIVCKMLKPRGRTICTLLSNISVAVLAVVFLIISLEQLGVNALTITTSLGMTGLALSIGSKDVISDLVAGLFIAFEGQIQLGDYVEINDFFGEIVSMGIRTVKLKLYNSEMIVNYTSISEVINKSRGLQAVMVSVVLPFNTDTARLEQLIKASEQRFHQACNGKLQGSILTYGITGFREYGMEYTIMGFAPSECNQSCATRCRTELLKILSENGIRPASMVPYL